MGMLEAVERMARQTFTGSLRPNYRQPNWREHPRGLRWLALSEPYHGDPDVSRSQKTWARLGVVTLGNGSLERLLGEYGARPAVARYVGGLLQVGLLESADDIGQVNDVNGTEVSRAHAFRIGPDAARFGVGILNASDQFITPSPGDVITQDSINVDMLNYDPRFANLNFS